MPIQKCADIDFGYDRDCPSGNFGLTAKGTSGRNGQTPTAILIRCIPEGYGEPCYVDGNLKKEADSFRESYNFIVKAHGEVIREVPEDSTSWVLKPRLKRTDDDGTVECPVGPYVVKYPECCPLDWTPINTAPVGGYIDDLILSIGVEVPKTGSRYPLTWGHKQCLCTSEGGCGASLYQNFNNQQLYKLARLIKWISVQYPTLTIDPNHYQFWTNITDCPNDECGCAPSIEELVCLATNFCEPVKNMAGNFVNVGQVDTIYGFNTDGIPVKESVTAALGRLLYQDAAGKVYIKNAAGLYIPLQVKP